MYCAACAGCARPQEKVGAGGAGTHHVLEAQHDRAPSFVPADVDDAAAHCVQSAALGQPDGVVRQVGCPECLVPATEVRARPGEQPDELRNEARNGFQHDEDGAAAQRDVGEARAQRRLNRTERIHGCRVQCDNACTWLRFRMLRVRSPAKPCDLVRGAANLCEAMRTQHRKCSHAFARVRTHIIHSSRVDSLD